MGIGLTQSDTARDNFAEEQDQVRNSWSALSLATAKPEVESTILITSS